MKPLAQLFVGHVWHGRKTPVAHSFRYPHAWLSLSLPECDVERLVLAPGIAWQRKRHGPRDGSALFPWLCERLAEHGIGGVARIQLHTLPAVLGYVFNPVSFYLAEDAQGRLLAAWVEVNNTFGGHHDYCLRADPSHGAGVLIAHAAKALQVSPFYRVEGQYGFRLHQTGQQRFAARIEYSPDKGAPSFIAWMSGEAHPSSAASWLRIALACSSLTFATWLRIHWQAFQLWRKGVPFIGKDGRLAPSKPPRSDT